MATPEKAILDTFYLRKVLPTPDELEMESINVDTLKEMAGKFPQTVLKGITSLLSQREGPILLVQRNRPTERARGARPTRDSTQ